jgi:hypothetical protein
MTSTGRLKRSCVCAVVAVFVSTGAVLALGFLTNQANAPSSGVADFQIYLLGIPLAPGWLLMRGTFEKTSLSSLNQILGPALLVLFISVVIDTGLIFVVWELLHRQMSQRWDSDDVSHPN